MNSDLINKGDRIDLLLPTIGPTRRTAINESKIEYVNLNANPILGCSHGCRYCYARDIDVKYNRVMSEEEWSDPKFFINFFDVLKNEVESGKINGEKEIFLSTMTDLYQPYSIKHGIPRKLISMLQDAKLRYRILTKSARIVEDIDILSSYKKGKVGLSITTDSQNEFVRKYWEPKTANIKSRLLALQKLNEAENIPLWVSAEPFLPNTEFERYYREILFFGGQSLKEIIIGKMNHVDKKVDLSFDWKSVVDISEKYRKLNLQKIRFHYKREFWIFLQKYNLTPVELDSAPSEQFCYRDQRELLSYHFDKLPRE